VELPVFDPLAMYRGIRANSDGETFFLESIEGTKKTARYSFIGVEPVFRFRSKGNKVEGEGKVENPYRFLKGKFEELRPTEMERVASPFAGGMVGYFGYDIVRFFEDLPCTLKDDLKLPDAYFVVPKHLLVFNHIERTIELISLGRDEDFERRLFRHCEGVESEPLRVKKCRKRGCGGKHRYERGVEKSKEYIACGDIFQVVLSRRNEFGFKGNELRMYEALRKINPSPYMFFLDFEDTKIMGSSPEMLVRLENRRLTTRPLAGTRPRRLDNVEEDEKLKVNMLLDEKERAEHVMLVDLHRNDMGRVSKYGSVKVTELMGVEKYSHVQHIFSNVESELGEDKDAFDALEACFPAGTVSGAPKVRAMEVIEELEERRRGPYAGVVGYFDYLGNMDFAITIRSMFTKDGGRGRAFVQAGAGIVADSVPEREYLETQNKMEAMIDAIEESPGD
jgi:anthranilate synthase component 1